MISPQIDLIITTRNRVSDALFTIRHCLDIGFAQHQIYIVDDASVDGTEELIKQKYPAVKITRNETPKGYIVNRNFLMGQTTGNYLLSLDDDSHIRTVEDITEAIDILSSSSAIGIFGFKPYEQIHEPPAKTLLANTTRDVRTYIGCGHLIKREVINKLGNYRSEFEFYCEELDYSIRAYKAGYKVVTKDNLVVHHRIDWSLRSQQFQDDLDKGVYGAVHRSTLGFSNNLLVVALHFPFPFNHLFVWYYSVLRFRKFYIKKKDHEGFAKGWQRFRSFRPYIRSNRNPVGYRLFFKWIGLKTK